MNTPIYAQLVVEYVAAGRNFPVAHKSIVIDYVPLFDNQRSDRSDYINLWDDLR